MKKEEKVEFIQWVKGELESAPAMVLADYRGLSVAQITELRDRCREADVKFKVVKNTLMQRAVEGTPMDVVKDMFTGPSALAWHSDDPGAAARVLVNFAKARGNEALEIKGGAVTGRMLSAQEVQSVLATLPSRNELLGTMAGLIDAGPGKLHRVLSAGPAKLGRVIRALEERRAGADG